jgi:hypothetical protein
LSPHTSVLKSWRAVNHQLSTDDMEDFAVDDVVHAICQSSIGELMKSLSGQLVVCESEMNELVANCDRSRTMQFL